MKEPLCALAILIGCGTIAGQPVSNGPLTLRDGSCRMAFHPNAMGGSGIAVGLFRQSDGQAFLIAGEQVTLLPGVALEFFFDETPTFDPGSNRVLVPNRQRLFGVTHDLQVTRLPDLPNYGTDWRLASVPVNGAHRLYGIARGVSGQASDCVVSEYRSGLWIPVQQLDSRARGHGRPFWHTERARLIWQVGGTGPENDVVSFDPLTGTAAFESTGSFPFRAHRIGFHARSRVVLSLSGSNSQWRARLGLDGYWESWQSTGASQSSFDFGNGDALVVDDSILIYRPGTPGNPRIIRLGELADGEAYGQGCGPRSTGVPVRLADVDPTTAAEVGGIFDVTFQDAVVGAPTLLAIGTTQVSIPLYAAGYYGCRQWTSFNIALSLGVPAMPDFAPPVQIPSDPTLVGARIYLQGAQLAQTANAGGMVFTNGIALTLGYRW